MRQDKGEKARQEVETLSHTAEKQPIICKLNKVEEHKAKRQAMCITWSATAEYFFMLLWN